MYIGRIVAVGCTPDKRASVLYRVSSRSFPNRRCLSNDAGIAVVPKPGYEEDIEKNPYIAYNCLRLTGEYAVVTNGSHTDPIVDKLRDGVPARDALISCLHGMDYEHDHLNTPRIAAVVTADAKTAYIGVVRKDALLVRAFALTSGSLYYVGTYEHDTPSEDLGDKNFDAVTAEEASRYILGRGVFADYQHAVTSAAAVADDKAGFTLHHA